MMREDSRPADLQAHDDAMWERAHGAIAAGDIDCDQRLAAGPDARRGLTLIARPGAALAARFDAPLGSMRVDQLELVVNDWYMSSASLRRLDVLRLPS